MADDKKYIERIKKTYVSPAPHKRVLSTFSTGGVEPSSERKISKFMASNKGVRKSKDHLKVVGMKADKVGQFKFEIGDLQQKVLKAKMPQIFTKRRRNGCAQSLDMKDQEEFLSKYKYYDKKNENTVLMTSGEKTTPLLSSEDEEESSQIGQINTLKVNERKMVRKRFNSEI